MGHMLAFVEKNGLNAWGQFWRISMVLSSWNTLGVDLCSIRHNSGLFQFGDPRHCQDRSGKLLSPSWRGPGVGADYPRSAEGRRKVGPGTLLSQSLMAWKLLQSVAPSCPSPLTQSFPNEAAVITAREATALWGMGWREGRLSPWD